MRLFATATGALAALTLMGSAPTIAADLGYGDPPSDRYRSAYEDSRYRDIFGPPPQRARAPYAEEEDEVVERDVDVPPPRVGTYHDRESMTTSASSPGATTATRNRRYRLARRGPQIRDRLMREGWNSFEELDVRHRVAIVEARRPNGLPYRLKIDRCSGDVVSAEPLAPVPYAYQPRRYEPYYR